MAIVRMLHVALAVRDVERSRAFYRDRLHFTVLSGDTHPGSVAGRALGVATERVHAVLLRRDDVCLQLLQRDPPDDASRAPHAVLSHLALAVDDLASTLHSLRDRGVAVDVETLTEHAPGVRSCVIRDPDGLAILLCQAPAGTLLPWDDDAPGGNEPSGDAG
jgi:catechol 2,3-dioxygenase-like lactoylglutathione lyase family enzyme